MKRIFVLYRDKDSQRFEGDAWNAYSFETKEEAEDFVEDLEDPESVWASEAVIHLLVTIDVPSILYVNAEQE